MHYHSVQVQECGRGLIRGLQSPSGACRIAFFKKHNIQWMDMVLNMKVKKKIPCSLELHKHTKVFIQFISLLKIIGFLKKFFFK